MPGEAIHSVRIDLTAGNLTATFICSQDTCDLCADLKSYAKFEPWTYYDGPLKHSLHSGFITLRQADDCVVWAYGAIFKDTSRNQPSTWRR